MKRSVGAIALCLPLVVAADTGRSVEQSYFRNFGQLWGEIHGVRAWVDKCGELYPDTGERREAAYRQWSERNQALIDELNGHFGKIQQYWAALPGTQPEALDMDKLRQKSWEFAQSQVGKAAASMNAAELREHCNVRFPNAMASPASRLESMRAARVAIVRDGPNEVDGEAQWPLKAWAQPPRSP